MHQHSDSVAGTTSMVVPVTAALSDTMKAVPAKHHYVVAKADTLTLPGDLRMPRQWSQMPTDSLSTAIVELLASDTTITVPPQWTRGNSPNPRAPYAGADSWLLALLAVAMTAAALCGRYLPTLWANLRFLLSASRRRASIFDDTPGLPWWVKVILTISFVVFGGTALSLAFPAVPQWPLASALVGIVLVGGLYLFRQTAYAVTGYAFGESVQRKSWSATFTATRAACGLFIAVPVWMAIFAPQWCTLVLWCVAAIYLVAQLAVIYKGFRIFYSKITSLLYFFLYLCTLELIPDMAVISAAVKLWVSGIPD